MKFSFVDRLIVFSFLLIKDPTSAAGAALLRTDVYEQLADATTANYVDDVTPTSDFADVTDFLTAPGEVTDYAPTSSQYTASITPADVPDVAGLTSTIDTSSVIVTSTALTTMTSKYPSLSTPKLSITGELISNAEIGHWNGTTRAALQSSSIVTTAAALIWSPSLTSEGDSVNKLNANTSVGATSGPSTLLSSDTKALAISILTTSSGGPQSIDAAPQATTWPVTIKNSSYSSTPTTLSGGAVPPMLPITTERGADNSTRSDSPDTKESTVASMPLTRSGVTHNISVLSPTTLSATTKDFFTNSKLTTSTGTIRSAFSITTQPASLGATGNAATFGTSVTSSSSIITEQATTPVDSKYVITVPAPPTLSGTINNVVTISKLVTTPDTTKTVVMNSTIAISRASMHSFSIILLICALAMPTLFIKFMSQNYVQI